MGCTRPAGPDAIEHVCLLLVVAGHHWQDCVTNLSRGANSCCCCSTRAAHLCVNSYKLLTHRHCFAMLFCNVAVYCVSLKSLPMLHSPFGKVCRLPLPPEHDQMGHMCRRQLPEPARQIPSRPSSLKTPPEIHIRYKIVSTSYWRCHRLVPATGSFTAHSSLRKP